MWHKAEWMGHPVVAPHRVLSKGQIELFDIETKYKQITPAKLFEIELII